MTITMTSPSRSVLCRGLIAILACLLWLLFAQNVAWASATNEITGKGSESGPLLSEVTGKVTDEAGTALDGIRVTANRLLGDPAIDNPRWKPVASTTTDNTGAYRFSLPIEPTYRIGFSDMSAAPQYVTEYYPDAVASWQGADITFVQGSPVSGIDAQLAVGAVVLGQVTDNAGASLTDIYAQGYKMVDDGSGNVTWSQFSSTEVDEQGKYTLTFAYSGTVRVSFYDFRWPAIYPGEYYDNVSMYEFTEDLPKNIEARIGEIISGIDAQLDTFGLISGRVTDKQGTPLQGVFVQAYVLYTNTYGTASWVGGGPGSVSDMNGYYTQPVQFPGTAHICFSGIGDPLAYLPTCFGGNSNDPAGGADISVSVNTLVENINVQLARTSRLVGQLTDQGGNPIGGGAVIMYAVDPPQPVFYMAYPDTQGRYSQVLPPGTFKVASSGYGCDAQWFANKSSYEEADLVTIQVEADTQLDFQHECASSINGRVVDENGQPMPDVSVTAYRNVGESKPTWENINLTAQTNVNGQYSLRNLVPGTYRVQFYGSKKYQEEYFDNVSTFDEAQEIHVAEKESVNGIDAQLVGIAYISGHLTDANGNPLTDAAATLYRPVDDGTGNITWQQLGRTMTNGEGDYELSVPYSGVVRVGFEDANPSFTLNYQPEFYDNVVDQFPLSGEAINRATDITLTTGTTVRNINAQLDRLGVVAGNVTNQAGIPISDVMVSGYQLLTDMYGNLAWFKVGQFGVTDANGHYQMKLLQTGIHRICFGNQGFTKVIAPKCYGSTTDEPATGTDVAVEYNKTITGIDIRLSELGRITGKVTDVYGHPLPETVVMAHLAKLDANGVPGIAGWLESYTDKNGFYEIGGIEPGVVLMSASYGADASNSVSEWYENTQDYLLAKPITVELDSLTTVSFELEFQKPKLTLKLDSNPNSRLNVHFDGDVGQFALDDPTIDDGDKYTNSKTFETLLNLQTIRVTHLPKGKYVTKVVCDPEIWNPWNASTMSLEIYMILGHDLTCTLTVERGVNIRGMVYHDRNGNGSRNRDEPWLPGWSTYVFRTDGSMYLTVPTNGAGRAEYNLLPPGQYVICAVMQEGWSNSQPGVLDPAQQQPCYTLDMPAVTGATVRFGMITANSASYRGVPSESPDGVEIVLENVESDEEEPSEEEASAKNWVFLPVVTR